MRVAGVAYGDEASLQWGTPVRAVDFFDVKGDVEALLAPRVPTFEPASHPAMHPGRCARVLLNGKPVGYVGELHPRWRQLEGWQQAPVMFELDLPAVLGRDVPVAQTVARHQPVERDIAVVVKEGVTHAALMDAVHAAGTNGWLKQAVLFDVYRPKKGAEQAGGLAADEKSLAVRLTLERSDATLTDEEIDGVVKAVLAELAQRVQARLRA
jgi:phenylalanyl-tRNA synthetase beta chain